MSILSLLLVTISRTCGQLKEAFKPSKYRRKKILLLATIFSLFALFIQVYQWTLLADQQISDSTGALSSAAVEREIKLESPLEPNSLEARLAGSKKVVVFSTNNNPFYSFVAPLTTWVWKHRIGYDPIVLLSEDVHPLVKAEIENAGGIAYTVNHTLGGEHHGRVMQTSRLLVSALPFQPGTLIMTGDADMIPVKRDYFHQYNEAYRFHAFNGGALEDEYPICYLLADRDTWREIADYRDGEDIPAMINRIVEKFGFDDFSTWSFDQRFVYNQVQAKAAGKENFIEILGHGLREDRSEWAIMGFTEEYIDAHVLRPTFVEYKWQLVVENLLNHIMPDNVLQWALKYREDFVQQVRGGDPSQSDLVDGYGRWER